jgi:hypothetical protein
MIGSSGDGWVGTSVSSNSINGWATWDGAVGVNCLNTAVGFRTALTPGRRRRKSATCFQYFSLGTLGFAVKIDVKSLRIAGTPLSFAGDTTCPVALVVGGRLQKEKSNSQPYRRCRSTLGKLYAGAGRRRYNSKAVGPQEWGHLDQRCRQTQ